MSAQNIHSKLEAFIKSYHLQQLLQGLLSTALQGILLFYLINYTEYLLWLESGIRGLMFYGFWAIIILVFIVQVIIPLAKFTHVLSNRMGQELAAKIIGNHFPDISDKLLNLLQLEQMSSGEREQSALLLKSIEQKTEQLSPFSFLEALDWPAVRKSLFRFSALILLLISWGIYDSPNISAASQRILNYNTQYSRPAPFEFIANFSDTQISEHSNYAINLKLEGEAMPEEVMVRVNDKSYLMKSETNHHFSYQIKDVKESFKLKFEAAGFRSLERSIEVIPKFELENLRVELVYPAYMGKPKESLNTTGPLRIPAGSTLNWYVNSNGADRIFLGETKKNNESINQSSVIPVESKDQKVFRFHTNHLTDGMVKFWSSGDGISSDTFWKAVYVIADSYPEIQVEQNEANSDESSYFVLGNAVDDYGITSAFIEYEVEGREDSQKGMLDLKIETGKSVVFSHVWNLKTIGILPNKGLRYRIAVKDNDAIFGGKIAYSDWFFIRRWSDEEYEKQINQSQDKIEKQLSEAQSQAQKLQKQSDKLKESMSVSPNVSFDMQEKVENWLDKQQEQLKRLEEIKKEQEKIDRQQKEVSPKNDELKERRKELNERMDRLNDPKLQELMKELQELLSRKKSPQEIQQKMDQIDRRMQNQKDDMDQLLEQLKELRMEEQIDLQAQEMEEWIEKQAELQSKTTALEKMNEDSKEKSEAESQLKEELKSQEIQAENIEKRAAQIQEQNKKLQNPMNLDLGKEEIKEAQSKQEKATQELEQKRENKSKEAQKQAAEKMKEAQQKMQNSLEKAQKERNSEDLKTLRALLENLIEVSHKQETIFTELASLNSDNPKVLALNKSQMDIKRMSEGIEDSLRALAKRQPMVSDMVTREITDINDNMERAFEGLKVRNVRQAASYEQFVMTGYNNLAVMLMESLKNVQQKMNQQSSSSPKNGKMCENPKPGNSGKSQKGKGSKLSEKQKELGEKLQQMQKEGKQGKSGSKKDGGKDSKGGKGDPKSGENGKPNSKGSSGEGDSKKASGERISDKEWVEMVLMQEELRRKIEALRKEMLKEGKTGQAANLFEAEKLMEEQEKNWVEKKFDAQMMWRQKQIETRLLEHEKAQMKQDQEENRESNAAKKPELIVPPEWIEKQRQRVEEREQLQKGAPQWQPYYRKKSELYLRKGA